MVHPSNRRAGKDSNSPEAVDLGLQIDQRLSEGNYARLALFA